MSVVNLILTKWRYSIKTHLGNKDLVLKFYTKNQNLTLKITNMMISSKGVVSFHNAMTFYWYSSDHTQPTFQRRINVVSTLWINVEITLIRRWKWNKIRRRIFNVAQHWYNVAVRRWNNVDTTLSQLCSNLASTIVKAVSKPVGLVLSTDSLNR